MVISVKLLLQVYAYCSIDNCIYISQYLSVKYLLKKTKKLDKENQGNYLAILEILCCTFIVYKFY